MVKLFQKPIKVKTVQSRPVQIFWQEKSIHIKEIFEHWKDTGCWWEKESEKDFYRAVDSNQNIFEFFYDHQEHQWYLYKLYD